MNLGEVTQRNRAAGRKRASGERLGGDGGVRRDWCESCRRCSRGRRFLELTVNIDAMGNRSTSAQKVQERTILL